MEPRRRKQLVTKVISVPGNLRLGCDEFNAGKFFESHERFEEIWQLETGPVRNLYKGLIQIAAGFVHLSRGKYIGAERLLRTGVEYMTPYRSSGAMGFDVDGICRDAENMHERLRAAGPGAVMELDFSRRPFYACDPAVLRNEALRWHAWGFDETGEPESLTITVAE